MYLDSKEFGADKGEEDCTYNGFVGHDDEESKDVDQAEEAAWRQVLLLALPEPGERGGTSNKIYL